MEDISDHGSAAQVFPITKRPTFELLTEFGEFTSACAITPYEGGAFGGPAEPAASWLFVAEPVHNLVHRDVLAPSGATFVARRSHESREFLAAGDSWFRPVFLYTGPDAALYVVDYYRARIEHPEWSASDLQKNPAPLYEGQERGRIYRIVPAGRLGRSRRVGARIGERRGAGGGAVEPEPAGGGAPRSGCSSIGRRRGRPASAIAATLRRAASAASGRRRSVDSTRCGRSTGSAASTPAPSTPRWAIRLRASARRPCSSPSRWSPAGPR